jgi:hypothetical protein
LNIVPRLGCVRRRRCCRRAVVGVSRCSNNSVDLDLLLHLCKHSSRLGLAHNSSSSSRVLRRRHQRISRGRRRDIRRRCTALLLGRLARWCCCCCCACLGPITSLSRGRAYRMLMSWELGMESRASATRVVVRCTRLAREHESWVSEPVQRTTLPMVCPSCLASLR